MIKIRLARKGRKNKPSYRIVVSDSKSPRDGKFIEKIGFYNNFNRNNFYIDINKFIYWKNIGAKISNRVNFLIKKFNK